MTGPDIYPRWGAVAEQSLWESKCSAFQAFELWGWPLGICSRSAAGSDNGLLSRPKAKDRQASLVLPMLGGGWILNPEGMIGKPLRELGVGVLLLPLRLRHSLVTIVPECGFSKPSFLQIPRAAEADSSV